MPLFAVNEKTGGPHSDSAYHKAYKVCLTGLQEVLVHYGIDYILFTLKDLVDEGEKKDDDEDYTEQKADDCCDTSRIVTEITPHSSRSTVISVNCQFLPPEYVGKYLTGQTTGTVCYYNKSDDDEFKRLAREQKKGISILSRSNMNISLKKGTATIMAADKNSALVNAFVKDPHSAAADFGAVSSHFFERDTGLSIIASTRNLKLAFEPTHICPFNRLCPEDRIKIGLKDRCNFCDYAVRTIDHLPAISCERRNLLEEMQRLELFVKEQANKLTDAQIKDINDRRNIIAEDLLGIEFAEIVLNNNLRQMIGDAKKGCIFHAYRPEAISQMLESAPFPIRNDEVRYMIARMNEVNAYPSLLNAEMKYKIANLRPRLLANTGNIREALLSCDENIDVAFAKTFSLVKNIMNVYSLNLDDIVKIINTDITEIMKLDTGKVSLIASNVLDENEGM